MNTDRIDFISSYCDGWCERCAFTDRCSAFACKIAVEMCGDARAALELAVGRPHPVDGEPDEAAGAEWLADLVNVQPSAEELAQLDRDERARRARLDRAPTTRMARVYTRRSTAWLKGHDDGIVAGADPLVLEARAIVMWDAYFIGAKLRRALDGRDRSQQGDDDGDHHPIQNDWNGSAKVALISLERSEAAWRVIADAIGDGTAAAVADAVAGLRRTVLEEFPMAMSFTRPGFDEPWR